MGRILPLPAPSQPSRVRDKMEVLSGTRGIKKKTGGGEGPAHYKATSPHPLPHSGDGPWGGVGGGSTRGSSRDVSTRYLQTAEILRNTGPPAQSPPLPAQPQTSHSSQGAQRRSPPWPSPAGPPPPGPHPASATAPPGLREPSLGTPPPSAAGTRTGTGRRLLACNSQGHAPPGRGPRSPQQVRDRAGATPARQTR